MRTETECVANIRALLAGTISMLEDRFDEMTREDLITFISFSGACVDAITHLQHHGNTKRTAKECAAAIKLFLKGANKAIEKHGDMVSKKEMKGIAFMYEGAMDAVEHLESMEQKETRPPLQ